MFTATAGTGAAATATSSSFTYDDYMWNDPKLDCGLGNVYVEGTLKGRVTVAAKSNVVITGDRTEMGYPKGAGTYIATFTASKAGAGDFVATLVITVLAPAPAPAPNVDPAAKTLTAVEIVTTPIYAGGVRGDSETKVIS